MARVYKATVKATHGDGTLVEPGSHWQTDVPVGFGELSPQEIADGIWTHIGSSLMSALSADITVHELVVSEQVIPPAIGVSGIHTVGAPGLGVAGDRHLPKELVPLILLHTATASRSARGHTFLASPLNSAALTTGAVWETSLLGIYTGLANALATSFDIGSVNIHHINPVIYSRTRHRGNLTPFVFPVNGATAKTRPTWLRSRATAP